MSKNHQLVELLKGLGYDNNVIRKIAEAADTTEIEALRASRDMMTQLLSPLQAAAQSRRHAALLCQLDGQIYHASGCKYRLPMDGTHVNIHELDKAIRAADIDTRMRIKSGLRALGRITA